MKIVNYKTIGEGTPLIILHGLFGSLDNWQSIAKELGKNFKVILVDVRNHGRSFHDTNMSFEVMNEDIIHLMNTLQLPSSHFLGHSMGGKIAMNFATCFPLMVSKLIVVDVAPYQYPTYHHAVFEALFSVPIETIQSRNETEQILRKSLSNEMEIQFLMKGLSRKENGGFEWKFNLDVLHQNYTTLIQHIPLIPYLGKTLFIKGEKSNYITMDKIEFIPVLFPNYEIDEIKNANHWIHADQPIKFIESVINFLGK